MSTTIFGIKNCDSVKKARKWLEANNIEYNFHDFREDGLDASWVTNLLKQAPLSTVINKRSTTWKTLDSDIQQQLNETNAVDLCVNNPTLIKRPVIIHGNQTLVGFNLTQYEQCFFETNK